MVGNAERVNGIGAYWGKGIGDGRGRKGDTNAGGGRSERMEKSSRIWDCTREERMERSEVWSPEEDPEYYRTLPRGVDFHVRVTENNTHVTAWWWTEDGKKGYRKSSAGVLGYKGGKRGTSEATQSVVRWVGEKLLSRGKNKVHLYLNGTGPGRGSVISSLQRTGVGLLSMTDSTPEAHAGCRGKKRRRI